MKNILQIIILVCIIIALTSACTNQVPTAGGLETENPTATFTETTSPTDAPKPTVTPLSPLPTLPADESKILILDLLEDNGGCQLPCLWGITPGITSWQEAEQNLSRFSLSFGDFWDNNGYQSISVRFPSPIEVSYISYLEQNYLISNEKVVAIVTYNYDITPLFRLGTVLQNYGQPDVVGLFTYASEDAYSGSRPTGVIVFYKSKGIMINYFGAKSVENIDNNIRICPDGTYSFMYLWDSSLDLSFDEAINLFGGANNIPYPLQLQEASTMSVPDFYQTYQDSKASTCIDTPLELWPEP